MWGDSLQRTMQSRRVWVCTVSPLLQYAQLQVQALRMSGRWMKSCFTWDNSRSYVDLRAAADPLAVDHRCPLSDQVARAAAVCGAQPVVVHVEVQVLLLDHFQRVVGAFLRESSVRASGRTGGTRAGRRCGRGNRRAWRRPSLGWSCRPACRGPGLLPEVCGRPAFGCCAKTGSNSLTIRFSVREKLWWYVHRFGSIMCCE
jgi:hypothetical protein